MQKDKHAWLEKQANQTETAAACNEMQAVYQVDKRISGSTKANPGVIKLKEGKFAIKR